MKNAVRSFILLFISFWCVTFHAAAQDTSYVEKAKITVKESVHTVDTSSNFKMIYSDLKSGIEALAQSLKVGTSHVYEVIVRQQIVDSITYSIILLVLGFLVYKMNLAIYNRWDKLVKENAEPLTVFPIVLTVIYIIVFLSTIDNIVTGFVNPEFGAINYIIEFVKESQP